MDYFTVVLQSCYRFIYTSKSFTMSIAHLQFNQYSTSGGPKMPLASSRYHGFAHECFTFQGPSYNYCTYTFTIFRPTVLQTSTILTNLTRTIPLI